MKIVDMLKDLCQSYGVAGEEAEAVKCAEKCCKGMGPISITPHGSLICRVKQAKEGQPHIVLNAHIDEIGLIVTAIDDKGFLKVAKCGGVDCALVMASPVVVHTEKEEFPGVVGSVPPHLQSGEKKNIKIEDVYIDMGFTKKQAEENIPIGSRISFEGDVTQLRGDLFSGKAMDDRAGCVAVIAAAEKMLDTNRDFGLTILLSTQEETGGLGARTGAFAIKPTHCIVVDVTFGATPDVSEHHCGKLGKGPMIGEAAVLDRDFSRLLVQVAKESKIPYQMEAMGGHTGTDADGIAASAFGVRCACVSIPLRYMHTPIEVLSISDIEETANLLCAACLRLGDAASQKVDGNAVEKSAEKCSSLPLPTLVESEGDCVAKMPATPAVPEPTILSGKKSRLIKELCDLDGVSGCEGNVAAWIQNRLGDICEFSSDSRGNLICFKKGKKAPQNKLMFSAHMDEVGFIITFIEEDGLLRFTNIGSVDSRVVVGKPVRLENGTSGVVGAKPIHLRSEDEREQPVKMDKLYIDIGASSREDAEKVVSIGDRVAFRSDFIALGDHKLRGKAIDNRAGCSVLMGLLRRELEYDITAVFTTQEETGGNGAGNAAFAIQPDIAVIIETTAVADVPGSSTGGEIATQGEGPCISFRDGGTVYDMELYRLALKIGKKKNISCQPKKGVSGSNESKAIQSAGAGARVLAVAMPGRYLHSSATVLDRRDVSATLSLLEALVEPLGELS